MLPCKLCAKARRTVFDSWPDLLNSGIISSPSKPSQQGQPSSEHSPLEGRAVIAVDLISLSTAMSLGVKRSRNQWKHKAFQTILIKNSRYLWVNPTQKQPGQRLYGFITGSWDSHIPTCQSVIFWSGFGSDWTQKNHSKTDFLKSFTVQSLHSSSDPMNRSLWVYRSRAAARKGITNATCPRCPSDDPEPKSFQQSYKWIVHF